MKSIAERQTAPIVLAFLLALASLIYEFALSYLMTILYGGLIRQYILTIGVFIFGLGIGSIIYERKKNILHLGTVEFLLCFMGLCSIYVPIIFYKSVGGPLSQFLSLTYIFLIALLSGIELPALMDMSKSPTKVLGADYFGMAVGSILFLLFFLPIMGLKPTILMIASINLICAYIVEKRKRFKIRCTIFFLCLAAFVFYSPSLEVFLLS